MHPLLPPQGMAGSGRLVIGKNYEAVPGQAEPRRWHIRRHGLAQCPVQNPGFGTPGRHQHNLARFQQRRHADRHRPRWNAPASEIRRCPGHRFVRQCHHPRSGVNRRSRLVIGHVTIESDANNCQIQSSPRREFCVEGSARVCKIPGCGREGMDVRVGNSRWLQKMAPQPAGQADGIGGRDADILIQAIHLRLRQIERSLRHTRGDLSKQRQWRVSSRNRDRSIRPPLHDIRKHIGGHYRHGPRIPDAH